MSLENMKIGSAIRFQSSLQKIDHEAVVELATVVLNGHQFTALGSVVDEQAGVVVGYPVRDMLCRWDGTPIAPLFVTGHARGFHSSRLICWAATINGRRYHGRNSGEHMLLKMRTRK